MALFTRLLSALTNSIKVNPGRVRFEVLFKGIPCTRLGREDFPFIVRLGAIKDFNLVGLLLKLSLRLSQYNLRAWSLKFSIAIFLVYFAYIFIPSTSKASDDTKYVACNNHYAIEIPKGEHFEGRYIRCEDFDHYYLLIETKQYPRAEHLLLH